MRRWRIEKNFGLANLRLSPIEDRDLLAHEVRIRIRAASLNYRDLMVVKGEYNPRQPLPLIPVSDGAGEVCEVGREVKSLAIGDKVCATLVQKWDHGVSDKTAAKSTLGCPNDGMLRESAIFHEQGLIKYPSFLSFAEASTLPCAALTAFNSLVYQANLLPGSTVLIQGTGGVSVFAQIFSKIFNFKTIVLSSSHEKLARMRELGANHLINYRETPAWEREVLTITEDLGVDLVIEVVGGATINQSVMSLKRGGLICLIGALGGANYSINLVPILMAEKKIHGVFVGNKSMFSAMNRVLEHNNIRPPIDKIFDFEHAQEAFTYLESAQHFGKIVIKI